MNYIYFSLDDIQKQCYELSQKIRQDGFEPDVIVAVARGGFPVARFMADLLSVVELQSVQIELYKNITEKLENPNIINLNVQNIEGKKVLLCDDIVDTGATINLAINYLKKIKDVDLKVLTLHVQDPPDIFVPDYYHTLVSGWVIYPWEFHETVKAYIREREKEGKTRSESLAELKKLGLNPDWLKNYEM